MKTSFLLLALVVFGAIWSCAESTSHLNAVKPFELNRYLGTWYELARFDHSFERGLSNVTATYTPKEDKIEVLNKGYDDKSGEWDTAKGKAKFAGDKNVGYLKVSFFGPFYGDYKIIKLDPNYEWAVVTSSSYKYLWILSRQSQIPKAQKDELVKDIKSMGFKTDALIWVKHDKNDMKK